MLTLIFFCSVSSRDVLYPSLIGPIGLAHYR